MYLHLWAKPAIEMLNYIIIVVQNFLKPFHKFWAQKVERRTLESKYGSELIDLSHGRKLQSLNRGWIKLKNSRPNLRRTLKYTDIELGLSVASFLYRILQVLYKLSCVLELPSTLLKFTQLKYNVSSICYAMQHIRSERGEKHWIQLKPLQNFKRQQLLTHVGIRPGWQHHL